MRDPYLHEAFHVLVVAGSPGAPPLLAPPGSPGTGCAVVLQFHGHALEPPRPLLAARFPPPALLLVALPHLRIEYGMSALGKAAQPRENRSRNTRTESGLSSETPIYSAGDRSHMSGE